MLELDELSIYVGLHANMLSFTLEEGDNWEGLVIVMKLLELHPSKIDLTKISMGWVEEIKYFCVIQS